MYPKCIFHLRKLIYIIHEIISFIFSGKMQSYVYVSVNWFMKQSSILVREMGVFIFLFKRHFLNYKLSGTLNVLSFWNFLTNFRIVAFHDIDLYPSSKFEEKNQYFSQLKVNDKLSHHPLNVKTVFQIDFGSTDIQQHFIFC